MSRKKKTEKHKIDMQTANDGCPDLNIVQLIRSENLDTKPNMAKFLKSYVKSIRICVRNGKIDLWPKIQYDISKRIIRFKDDQTLVKDNYQICVCKDFVETILTGSDETVANEFFDLLERFKFIRNGHEDVKVFSTDVSKTNSELEQQIKCAGEEKQQFVDYTPKITVNAV